MKYATRTGLVLLFAILATAPGAAKETENTPKDPQRFELSGESGEGAVVLTREGDWLHVRCELGFGFDPSDRNTHLVVYLKAGDTPVQRFEYHLTDAHLNHTRRRCALLDGEKWKGQPDSLQHFAARADLGHFNNWAADLWLNLRGLGASFDNAVRIAFRTVTPAVLVHPAAFVESPFRADKMLELDLSTLDDIGESKAPKAAHAQEVLEDEWMNKALGLIDEESVESGLRILKIGLQTLPTSRTLVDAWLALETRPKERMNALRRAVALCPAFVWAHTELIRELINAGRANEAHEHYLRITIELDADKHPKRSMTWVQRTGLEACAAVGDAERLTGLLDFELSVYGDKDERDSWGSCLRRAQKAYLQNWMYESARLCFERNLELYRQYSPESDRSWIREEWLEFLIDFSHFSQALEFVEGLDFELEQNRDSAIFAQYKDAVGMGLDVPDAIERIDGLIGGLPADCSEEKYAALLSYREVLAEHLADWNDEVQRREENAGKTNPVVTFEMARGTFKVELFEDDAPNTVANFVTLVEEGFYDGLLFYRVETGWIVQGGSLDNDPATDGQGWAIKNEANERQHWRGTIAMARTNDVDSADTTFFITTGNTRAALELATDWVVFGRITEGLEVAQRIREDDAMEKLTISNLRDHDYEPDRIRVEDD